MPGSSPFSPQLLSACIYLKLWLICEYIITQKCIFVIIYSPSCHSKTGMAFNVLVVHLLKKMLFFPICRSIKTFDIHGSFPFMLNVKKVGPSPRFFWFWQVLSQFLCATAEYFIAPASRVKKEHFSLICFVGCMLMFSRCPSH